MVDIAAHKKRMQALERQRNSHNTASFSWMMTAVFIYILALGLSVWLSNWWYLLLLPAAYAFYVGNTHNRKAHKLNWQIMAEVDKQFYKALEEYKNGRH